MILVTFLPPTNEFYAECNVPDKYHTIVDLYNKAEKNKINVTTLNRGDFHEIEKLMNDARENYLDFLGALSQAKIHNNKTIRDYKIFHFSIYWLTSIAEKQPRNHWLFSFFLFIEFLKNNLFLDKKIVVFLNSQTISLKNYILEYCNSFEKKQEVNFFISNNNGVLKQLLNIFKIHARFLTHRIHKQTSVYSDDATIQIITISEKQFFYTQFLNFSITKKYSIAYKPLSVSTINRENSGLISKQFFKHQPGVLSRIQIFLESVKLICKIYKLNGKLKIYQTSFPAEIIKFELFEVIKYSQIYFLNYLWYKNYFASIDKNKIFFLDDEFYVAGRIISKAFSDTKNEKIKLFGLQHGMFSYTHTLYTILQKEIETLKNEDAIPIPQKFIVWGDYFKKIFQSHNYNILKNTYVEVLGSPNFIELKNKLQNKSEGIYYSNYILWCTTGKEQFLYEKPFVLKIVERFQLPLIIRLHPVSHINQNFVKENLKSIQYQFDEEKDIYISILHSHFVITSAHSTIVLDCLVCNKKIIRIIFDRDDEIFLNDKHLIINLKNIDQIEQINTFCFKVSSNINQNNTYLYLNEDRWQKFINRELADNV